jgi:hypothetical protein
MASLALRMESFLQGNGIFSCCLGVTIGTGLTFRTGVIAVLVKIMVTPQTLDKVCMLFVSKLYKRSFMTA